MLSEIVLHPCLQISICTFTYQQSGNMSGNSFVVGEGESVLNGDKVKVDPGTPPSLVLKRKLKTKDSVLTEFDLTLKEKISMAPIGYRLRRHLREEKSKHSDVFLDPFTKRPTSSCHGVPLGGIG